VVREMTPTEKLLSYALATWSPWKWGACEVCGHLMQNGHGEGCGYVSWEKDVSIILGQAKTEGE